MAITIRTGGSSRKASGRTRTSKPKPVASRAAKRSTAHGTKKASKPAANTTTAATNGTRRSSVPQVSDAELKKMLTKLRKVGEKRDRLRDEHKEAVAEMGDLIEEAIDVIPPKMISDAVGVSVQWIYTQQKMRQRDRTAKRKPSNGRKRTGTTKGSNKQVRTSAKKTTGRPKIRTAR